MFKSLSTGVSSLNQLPSKARTRAIVAAAALAALSATASATTYVSEPFAESVGSLQGQTSSSPPGTIWLRAGTDNPPPAINVVSGSLTGPAELKLSTGNSLAMTGIGTTSGSTNRLPFFGDTTTSVTGTIYYSFLLRFDAITGSNSTTGGLLLALNNTGNSSQTGNPTVLPGRVQARLDPGNAGQFSLAIGTNRTIGSGDSIWYNNLSPGTTYFVVGEADVTSTANTASRLWINPDPNTYGGTAPTANFTDTTAGSTWTGGIKSVLLRQSPAPYLTLDELRVATSWAEVTPPGLVAVANGLYWDIDGANFGAGGTMPSQTWGGTSNWSTSLYGDVTPQTWTADKVAVFSANNDATGAYAITVSGTQSASGLVFEDGTVTVSGDEVDLTGAGTVSVATVHTATVSSVVGGAVGLTKTNLGRLVLSGANVYTNGTNINAGTVQFAQTNSMPSSGAVTVASAATLSINVGGAGEWTNATSGGGSIGGLIAGVGGQGTVDQVGWTPGSTLEINTANATGDVAYTGVIGSFRTPSTTESVGLTKAGAGTLRLSGNNTFSGPLTVASLGGVVALSGTNANAGQSMTIPTVSIGNAASTEDCGVKILVNDALPTNSLIVFGSSIVGTDQPSSLLQLYDVNALTGTLPTGPSFNQTVRGLSGSNGRVKAGLGTLTVNVPTGESYASSSVLRTDYDTSTNIHGVIIKTGAGRQDWNQSNGSFDGDFILQQGTVGIGDNNVWGPAANLHNQLIIQGGTIRNIAATSLNPSVQRVRIDNSFSFEVANGSDTQFNGASGVMTMTLNTANPTITVVPGTGTGTLIIAGDITDDLDRTTPGYQGPVAGFTKAGAATLILGSKGNDYRGETTITEGAIRVRYQTNSGNVGFTRIGDGNGRINLSGGTLEYNGSVATTGDPRTFTATNPLRVTANSTIAYNSTTTGLTDPITFEFSSNTIDRTGGTLTLLHNGASQGAQFRPTFSGSGFTYAGPVVVSNGGGTRSTVLQLTNTSGTQTWSGGISGDGSVSKQGDGTAAVLHIRTAGLTISAGTVQSIAAMGDPSATSRVNSLTITGTGNYDINDNKAIVDYTGTGPGDNSPSATIRTYLINGRGGVGLGNASWAGTGGITSSAAVADTDGLAVGYREAQPPDFDIDPVASFGGQTVDDTAILMRYTWSGDANLDGLVDRSDLLILQNSFNQTSGIDWLHGDFDYNGTCDRDDLQLLSNNYGNPPIPSSGSLTASFGSDFATSFAGAAAVPEPASLGLLGLAAVGLMTRRARRLRG